jgi:DNA-binding transcriptional MocR family regulator
MGVTPGQDAGNRRGPTVGRMVTVTNDWWYLEHPERFAVLARSPVRADRGRDRGLIESGDLAPGDAVPSITSLVEERGVARQTASEALQLLEDEGLTRRVPGPLVLREEALGAIAPAPGKTVTSAATRPRDTGCRTVVRRSTPRPADPQNRTVQPTRDMEDLDQSPRLALAVDYVHQPASRRW